jgi:hypothetical protein
MNKEQNATLMNGGSPMSLCIQKDLVVSKRHVSPYDSEFLQDQLLHRTGQAARAKHSCLLFVDAIGCVELDTYGWRVNLTERATEYLVWSRGRGSLAELIHLAKNHGCDWLTIDRDGPPVSGLPTFDEDLMNGGRV